MEKNKIEKAFSIFNGGEGLDHWSYSSTSTPFAKNIISYSFPQEVRRKFPFRYKANFGNLVNNVVQRLLADVIYKTKTIKETEWERDIKVCFDNELKIINENPPVDEKDKYGREAMIRFAMDCIPITKQVVKEIVRKEKLVCERYVELKEFDMIKHILGRIDYETKTKFIELKTKPPNLKKIKGKEEWNMVTQELPTEPTIENLTQTSFYYMATKKKPYLVYVNDKEYVIFDQSHELMKDDHLKHLYYKMIDKILLWEKMIMFCNGNIEELAAMIEPPDMNHFFYYQVEYKYLDKLVFAEVSIQYFLDNKWYAFGPVSSVQSLAKKNGGLDDEAPKKAMTDAMTKAFSHLGMSADVFLGMFENNKYVEDLKKEFSQKQNSVVQTTEPAYMDDTVDVDEIKNEISAAKTEKQFYAVKNKLRLKVNYLKNNNFKAYEQIREHTREHEDTLTNNQQ